MQRRDFLRRAAALGGAAALGRTGLGLGRALADEPSMTGYLDMMAGSVLNNPAGDSPVNHIVVLMMENRSFDHYLGWLADDDTYMDAGRGRYGDQFSVDSWRVNVPDLAYLNHNGQGSAELVAPRHWAAEREENPYRGCHHPDPGHSWIQGRSQKQHGFLGHDSRNDDFALGYYLSDDVETYAHLARSFTVFDHYHCSLLAPTFPNREYMHSATSGGLQTNKIPEYQTRQSDAYLGFDWPTIWDKLMAAGVSCGYYYVDLPAIALWGARTAPLAHHIEQFFTDAAAGTLPRVTFLDPGFTTGLRTDDHPYGDLRAGQNFVYNAFKAFRESRHWDEGVFFVNYDEWGGFFDHVDPPSLPAHHDDTLIRFAGQVETTAHTDDTISDANWSQLGFRIPTLMASPFALPGSVDHRLYDHTSILRFIEWRYLGAPAEGPGGGPDWSLTQRDRHANNIGALLQDHHTGADVHLAEIVRNPVPSAPCRGEELEGSFQPVAGVPEEVWHGADQAGEGLDGARGSLPVSGGDLDQRHEFERLMDDGFYDAMGHRVHLEHPGVDILGS